VKYVLEGSVRKSPDRVRIRVELVDTSSATELWTQKYDRPLTDIFAVQDEIVGKVVTTLNLLFKLEKKSPYFGTTSAQLTNNLDAFDDFLRAIEYHWRMTKDDNARARQWLEKAVKLDPKFAEGYAFLGWTYWLDAVFRWSKNPEADLESSFELAQKALILDDFGSNTDAYALLCNIDSMQRRFDQAVAEGERAVATNPNDLVGYTALSIALAVSGKPEDAIRAAEKATRLDPHGQDWYAYFVGNPLVQMKRYQEAMPLLERHIAVYPNNLWAHVTLIMAYVELGRDQNARAEAAEVMQISPHFAVPSPEKGVFKDPALNKRLEGDLHKAGLI
jgi:adenylate cyclase